jgi:hypothetical protein
MKEKNNPDMMKIFLKCLKNKPLEEILNDPIKSYRMLDLIIDYKKSIVNGEMSEKERNEPHKRQIIGENFSLIEI